MRELAIGDIHGCARAFHTLLDLLQLRHGDTVILLGDYIDRGPDSYEVIETILALNRQCTVVAIGGNHEKMLMAARDDLSVRHDPAMLKEWLRHGGDTTLASYARRGYTGGVESIPRHHWDFFTGQTLPYWESDTAIYVHAFLDPTLDMSEQPEFLLLWQTFIDSTRHKSGKPIVCGHTSQKSGLPALFDHGVCIDTYAHGGGWLTCYDIRHQTFFQANDRGQSRFFQRAELTP